MTCGSCIGQCHPGTHLWQSGKHSRTIRLNPTRVWRAGSQNWIRLRGLGAFSTSRLPSATLAVRWNDCTQNESFTISQVRHVQGVSVSCWDWIRARLAPAQKLSCGVCVSVSAWLVQGWVTSPGTLLVLSVCLYELSCEAWLKFSWGAK